MKSHVLIFLTLISRSVCLKMVPGNERRPQLQVRLGLGVVQGRKFSLVNTNGTYYGFLGVPYAKPPLGELRFKPPEALKKWTGVLDAREEPPMCLQFTGGSEDCLTLNIYTLKLKNELNRGMLLPVMVWIHGGAFIAGSSNRTHYAPDNLIQEDIIMVSIQYRLGILGFLSTNDLASPGNYGLKDQLQALKWIHENIGSFGGNSSRVTIFGQSAGSASVQYLFQIPQAANLFHAGIGMSGTSLATWARTLEPEKIAFQMGEALGIRTNSSKELVAEFRKVDEDDLIEATTSVVVKGLSNLYQGFYLSPTIEPPHELAVITRKNHESFMSGKYNKVPFMTGVTTNELGVLQLQLVNEMLGSTVTQPIVSKIMANPVEVVHKSVNIYDPKVVKEAALDIMKHYFGNASLQNVSVEDFILMANDDQFIRPALEFIRINSKFKPSYLYKFSFQIRDGPAGSTQKPKGVCHGEDLQFIFSGAQNRTSNEQDEVVRRKFVKLFANFAKTTNPTPVVDPLLDNIAWPAWASDGKMVGLNVAERLELEENPYKSLVEFWDGFYKKYGHPSYDTY